MEKHVTSIRQPQVVDQKKWDTLATHPLQSWSWGEFRNAMGIDVVRLGIYEDDSLVDGWQVTFHRVPHTPWTIGYFPKGKRPTKKMLEELKKLGEQKHAMFIQLEPDMTADLVSEILNLKIKPAHHPLFTKYTFVVDLTKSEDTLLKDMHSKTRYNIKVAQKHGVIIKEDNSEEAFAAYLRLTQETTERQGFFAHNTNYHKTMWNMMRTMGIAHLFTASYKGDVLSAWILFVWHDTVYYPYGSSSRNHREVMAPTLLLWEVVRWAKEKGLKKFDLWGALGPQPDSNDPWYGFHRFKEGFKPMLVEFAGSYDLIINKPLYIAYTIADSIRWKLLRLKK